MARGGYTFDDIKNMSPEEVLYLYHYQNMAERSRFDELGAMLGVIWNLEEQKQQAAVAAAGAPAPKTMFIPLSVAINPKILDMVYKKSGAESTVGGTDFKPPEGENALVKPMADMSKDDFLRMLGRR